MKKLIGISIILIIVFTTVFVQAQGLLERKHQIKVLDGKQKLLLKKNNKSKINLFRSSAIKRAAKSDYFEWDENSSGWKYYYKSEISYNSSGLIIGEIMYDEQDNEMYKTSYTYDIQNRLLNYQADMKLSANTWMPMEKYVYEYNSDGDIVLEEQSYYTGTEWLVAYGKKSFVSADINLQTKTVINLENYSSGYDTIDQYIYHYNANNLIVSEEFYQYYDGEFIPSAQYEYLYDQNNVDTGMIKKMWDGSAWRNQLLYCEYTWDNAQKEFLSSCSIYYFSFNGLQLHQRETYTRDANGSFSYLLEDEYNGTWQGNMRITIVNDENNNRILYDYDLNFGNGWEQLFMIVEEYLYDSENNMLSHIYRESNSNGILENKYKILYSDYKVVSGIRNNKSIQMRTYPNPCTETIFIDQNELINKEYKIYSLSAQLIQSGILNENEIKIHSLKSGMYILKIDNYQSTFIKE